MGSDGVILYQIEPEASDGASPLYRGTLSHASCMLTLGLVERNANDKVRESVSKLVFRVTVEVRVWVRVGVVIGARGGVRIVGTWQATHGCQGSIQGC